MPLQHAGEAVAHFARGRTDRHDAGDVGGAVLILPAGVDQEELAWLDRRIRLFGNMIMRACPMRAGRRDGREAGVLEQPGRLTAREQPCGGGQLGLAALGAFLLHPAQEAHHRRAVADRGGAVPGDLGGVLDRLGQHHRIAKRQHLGAACFQRLRDGGNGALGIGHDTLARKAGQIPLERRAVVQPYRIAQMRPHLGRDLLRGHEQVGFAVRMDDGIGQSDRRMRDIGPAHVQRPGDRVERRQHHGVRPLFGQPFADPRTLGGRAFARHRIVLNGQ